MTRARTGKTMMLPSIWPTRCSKSSDVALIVLLIDTERPDKSPTCHAL